MWQGTGLLFLYSPDYLFNMLQALEVLLQRTWDLVEVKPCMAEGAFGGVREGEYVIWRDIAENGGIRLDILSWC